MNARSRSSVNTAISSALFLSGKQFFKATCEAIRSVSGADLTLIGSLKIVEANQVEVLAYGSSDPSVRLSTYELCPAPCSQVVTEDRIVVHLDNLDGKFPNDIGIQNLNSKSYLGFPLHNGQGVVVGIVAMEWTSSLTKAEANDICAAVEPLLERIETEVTAHIVSHAFETLLTPAAGDPTLEDTAIFRTIAQQAAEIAQVHGAVLTKCVDQDAQNFRILAAFAGGELLSSAEGTLMSYDGTPCDNLRFEDTFFYSSDLQFAYPGVELFKALNVESYCGFGFRDREDNPIGHLAFLHNRPMSPRMLECRIVNVIALRARQELERTSIEHERNSLREALAVRRKLESLGTMAGTIAHDFNNQLAAVIGNTELALLELDHHHSAFPHLKAAEESIWRARDVVGELTEFAGNAPKTAPVLIGLNDIVSREVAALSEHLSEGIQIQTSLAEDIPLILGHSTQIHRMLSNLLINANDAMRGTGGVLKVRTAITKIAEEERRRCLTDYSRHLTDTAVVLEVTDSGPGMDAEAVERVFDPYFSTKGVSRGLGLSGVLGVARRLPAGLTFTSQLGAGSKFRLYFKPESVLPPLKDETRSSDRETNQNHSKCILVVDDQPDVLRTTSRVVASLGYDAIEALAGEDAVKLCENSRAFDAAIIDVSMPGIDGWETLKRLKQASDELPVLMMTGYDQSDPSCMPSRYSRVEILSKPFDRCTLRRALEQLFNK